MGGEKKIITIFFFSTRKKKKKIFFFQNFRETMTKKLIKPKTPRKTKKTQPQTNIYKSNQNIIVPIKAKNQKELEYFEKREQLKMLQRSVREQILQKHASDSLYQCIFKPNENHEVRAVNSVVARSMDEGMVFRLFCVNCEKSFQVT